MSDLPKERHQAGAGRDVHKNFKNNKAGKAAASVLVYSVPARAQRGTARADVRDPRRGATIR